MATPEQKLNALVSDMALLVALTKEDLRSRGYESVEKLAFQPQAYPVSLEVYEAVFRAAFDAGVTHGRQHMAERIGEYLKNG